MPLFVAIALFIFTNEMGAIYGFLANQLYGMLAEASLPFYIPPPHIQETVLKASLIDLLISPSTFLQVMKSIRDISSTLSSNDAFKFLQLLLNIFSLLNVYLSWRYETYLFSLILSLSLAIAYVQVEVLLVKYLLEIISLLLGSIPAIL
ncbi:hypothetical protein GFC01_10895 [Desulfofundulus thermobenzoicus]|uniref:Uncharacterized protein n=1 Tax=Desulfofundulus thermobenzoicus TaxID=29376 RepID=A0A6N7ITB1_9FIRM|nr:hypothetical protein [Desulfofundulus thermobenzoicus]MQL52759.1 hypothetical protein [Desulfofundulus thermobenzoicus]